MVGIYFSGTGNTKFCIEQFLKHFDENDRAYPIEEDEAVSVLENSKEIVFAYPVYYSNTPKIVRDFIIQNSSLWKNKKIFIIATMGLFSGDGTGVSARLIKRYGGTIIGGLHLKMPDSIGDEKVLKRSVEANQRIVKEAENKIKITVQRLKDGTYLQDGLTIWSHLAGLFCQRLYFYGKTKRYTNKLKIKKEKCIGCTICISHCPMNNLTIKNGKAVKGNRCTMCYRCISSCPKQAITLLGKEVVEQCKIGNYITGNK